MLGCYQAGSLWSAVGCCAYTPTSSSCMSDHRTKRARRRPCTTRRGMASTRPATYGPPFGLWGHNSIRPPSHIKFKAASIPNFPNRTKNSELRTNPKQYDSLLPFSTLAFASLGIEEARFVNCKAHLTTRPPKFTLTGT